MAILGEGIGRQGHPAPARSRQFIPVQLPANGPDISRSDKRQRHIVIGLFRRTAGGNHSERLILARVHFSKRAECMPGADFQKNLARFF